MGTFVPPRGRKSGARGSGTVPLGTLFGVLGRKDFTSVIKGWRVPSSLRSTVQAPVPRVTGPTAALAREETEGLLFGAKVPELGRKEGRQS